MGRDWDGDKIMPSSFQNKYERAQSVFNVLYYINIGVIVLPPKDALTSVSAYIEQVEFRS
jgi:hypothetical protein